MADRARASRWLAFLAHHLRHRVHDSNLEWWQLVRAVPQTVIASLVAVFVAVFAAIVTPLLAFALGNTSADALTILSIGLIIGAVFGAILGPRAGRSAHRSPALSKHSRATIVLIAVARDAGMLLAILCALTNALLLGLWLATRQWETEGIADWALSLREGDIDSLVPTLLVVVLVLGVFTVTRYLSELSGGMPQRSRPSLHKLLPSLLVGLTIGLALSAPWILLGMILGKDAQGVFVLCLMTTGFIGVPLGVGRLLATPVAWERESSPQTVLRGDRTGLLVTVLSSGAVGGLSVAVAMWAGENFDGDTPVLAIGVVSGVIIAAVVLFGSGTAWLSYTVARLWLALWGRLPVRLNTFLRDAHKAGVLRQTGPAYQLRHDLLTTHLARQWQPGRGLAESALRRTRARRRRTWSHSVLGVAAVLILVVVVAMDT